MKLTIAEKELIDGINQRAANAAAKQRACETNARNAAAAKGGSNLSAFGECFIYADFDREGRVGIDRVASFDEVAARRREHNNRVLPKRSSQSGFCFTYLCEFGSSSYEQSHVSAEEYVRRYRLWRELYGASSRHPVMRDDARFIIETIGWTPGSTNPLLRLLGFGPKLVRSQSDQICRPSEWGAAFSFASLSAATSCCRLAI